MPWLRLLFLATAVALPSPLWRRRALGITGVTGGLWSDVAKAKVRSEEVLSAGGNADSPWNKPRSYKAFSLQNGLRVLLVEDDGTDQMEVAFTLSFGQFDDPKDLPGLAHLTEHLLLSGPGPDGQQLETWLEPRTGESNGFTGFESALFTLSCGVEDWQEALQRFGHCFRRTASGAADARFVGEAVDREVLRIDGEFQDGLSAGLRSLQLLRYRTEEEHPLHAFGPGSLKTLLPRGNGPEELARLAHLSQELFSQMLAVQSTLAIVSSVPTAQLEQAVGQAFGALATQHAPSDLLRPTSPTRRLAMADPLPGQKAAVPPCLVVESRENPGISFTWSVPFQDCGLDAASFRASKPLVALSHLVAHQGPGSLSVFLQKHGWLPDNLGPKITAQVPFSTEHFAIWELKIKLSPQGLQNWTRVVTAVVGLLAALRRRRYVQDAQGGPRRDALRQAVDEVSTLADIAWRFPPRPPLSSELAVDLRTAPRPAAYVFASRRLFAAREWRPEGPLPQGLGGGTAAARFTSTVAQEDATNAVSQVIECLVPERARLTLWSTVPQPGTQHRRDANLGLNFGELPLEPSLQRTWLAASEEPAEWWCAPQLNVYLSKATKIRKPAAEPDPLIPEAIKSKKGFNGVLWSEACRARLVEPKPVFPTASRIPTVLWVVPGCVYVSGQFNERVEPLGEEPVVTLTLWLPARCIVEASIKSRAAGRMWLKSLQVALESPFFGAALAGCRWECAFFTIGPDEAGMRLSFQAFSDNLSSFAVDAARAIGQHEGPEDLELVRRMALTELKTLRTAEAKELKGVLEQMQKEEIRKESQALWQSIAQSIATSSQALVAGAISEEEAADLVRLVLATLPLPAIGAGDVDPLQVGPRPAAVLTKRPSWQGPVAQSLCRASGLPALLDVCGRAMKG